MTSFRQIYAYQRARPKARTAAQHLIVLSQLLLQAKNFFFAKQSHLIPSGPPLLPRRQFRELAREEIEIVADPDEERERSTGGGIG
jgi:hypothetical protein